MIRLIILSKLLLNSDWLLLYKGVNNTLVLTLLEEGLRDELF